MTNIALAPSSVDAVASFYALGHVPAARQPALFAEIATWLRPGGVLVTSAPVQPGDGIDPAWLGVPMFFGGMGEDATLRAVAAAGLAVTSADRVAENEGDGQTVEWLWVTAVKPPLTRRATAPTA